MAGYLQAQSTGSTWNTWHYQTVSAATTSYTTTNLTWDKWNGTASTTSMTYQIAIDDGVNWSNWIDESNEIRMMRTLRVDGNGHVLDHPRNLTARQKNEAERTWQRFLRDQPEQEQRRLQRERARNGNVNPMLQTADQRARAQYERDFEAQQRQRLAEERAWAERNRAEIERQRIEMAALQIERDAANKRAEKLLVENLSLKQAAEYAKSKHIIVHGRHARYRIRQGRSMNIDVIDRSGLVTGRLCAYPSHTIPDCDTMLAQKLMLETDEDAFLRVAIPHGTINREMALPALQ